MEARVAPCRTIAWRNLAWALIGAVSLACLATPAAAQVRLTAIARVKGQDQNTLNGIGLVVGLKGTGDGGAYLPTLRALATAMNLMGQPLGPGSAVELKDAKNVALVMVTATVSGSGHSQGDQIDCVVNSIGAAKSLVGGTLFTTPLLGPDVASQQVYAFAEGPLAIDDDKVPTSGRIFGGCRLEEEFNHVYTIDDRITLLLDEAHADFELATEVAELINGDQKIQSGSGSLARALDQVRVEVRIPSQYLDEPAAFVSQVLALEVPEPQTTARVVVNERAGSVVIDGDVRIGAAIVHHKNVVIDTGENVPVDRFAVVDPRGRKKAELQALVDALNAVKVPPTDVIEIIKRLHKSGNLYGKLIVE